MGITFISKVLELFGQFFMKFWNFPMGDLGFNLGTFVVFILLMKFAMSVFLSIDIQPVSTRQGFSKVGSGMKRTSKYVGKQVARGYRGHVGRVKDNNKQKGKFKGGAGANKFTGKSSGWGIGD